MTTDIQAVETQEKPKHIKLRDDMNVSVAEILNLASTRKFYAGAFGKRDKQGRFFMTREMASQINNVRFAMIEEHPAGHENEGGLTTISESAIVFMIVKKKLDHIFSYADEETRDNIIKELFA